MTAIHGYDEAALLRVGAPPEPPGFAAFWSGLHARARAVDPDPVVHGSGRVLDVEFTSLDGIRLGGWLVRPDGPAGRPAELALVVGHGYGGRDQPDLELVPDGAAAFFPVFRGLPDRGLVPGIPAVSGEHVLHGIGAASTYVHGGCAADLWCAASALLALLPAPPARLAYAGSSFGGGIGALALPWDDRFGAAVLHVPSFGNHDVRLAIPCAGSGEAVRRHVAAHPEAREVLRFFDAATAAARLSIPTLVAPALADPVVPPPGQFAVYNALPGQAELLVLDTGHANGPAADADRARYAAAARAFLTR